MYDIASWEPPEPAVVEAMPSLFHPSLARSIAILLTALAVAILVQAFIRRMRL